MRILGIDIGSSSVKAVELDSAFGKFEVHDYYELQIEPGDDPAQITARLMGSLSREPDKVVATLPSSLVTFRNLKVPTRDKKAVQAAVTFELEDDLPFDMDDAAVAHSVLSNDARGSGAQVHIAATLKRHLVRRISELQAVGVDPDVITSEAWAFRTYVNRAIAKDLQERPLVLVVIGSRRTTLYVHHRGVPVLSRDIDWGGEDITAAIQERYGVSREEAEKAKLDNGFVLPPSQRSEATAEQIEFSDVIRKALDRLLMEIRQTDLTCKHVTHEHLRTVYLSGSTSLLPGLRQLIEEENNVTTTQLQALSALSSSGVTYSEQTDAAHLHAVAAALCMAGPDRAQLINLRKGEFAKEGKGSGLSLENLRKPLIGLGVVTASLIISLSVQSQVYESRLQDLDDRLETSMRSFFGGLSRSAKKTYLASPSKLKSAISDDLSVQRKIAELGSPNPHAPLDFLKTLSSSIPKSLTLDLTSFEVGLGESASYDPKSPGKAAFTFVVKEKESVAALTSALGSVLSGIKASKPEEVKWPHDENAKGWKVTVSGTPKSEAFGD